MEQLNFDFTEKEGPLDKLGRETLSLSEFAKEVLSVELTLFQKYFIDRISEMKNPLAFNPIYRTTARRSQY